METKSKRILPCEHIYHYTAKYNEESIKEKGLLNIFGLIFFTTNTKGENSVCFGNQQQMIQVSVKLTNEYRKVSDMLETDYDLLSKFFNPELIHLIGSNINEWYVLNRDIKINEIVNIKDML